KMLLKKAYDALPAKGALIVYEQLIDDERRTQTEGLLASLQMLLSGPGGFNFTGADCIGWMREAGFINLRIEPLTTHQTMIVGLKCLSRPTMPPVAPGHPLSLDTSRTSARD